MHTHPLHPANLSHFHMSGITLLLILAVVMVLFMIGAMSTFVGKHTLPALIIRFMIGHHLDGKLRTNAGFIRRGDTVLHPTGHASKWAHMPHLHRAAIRWSVVLLVIGITYGSLVARMLTIGSLIGASVLIVAVNERRIQRKLESRYVTRGTVKPLSQAIAGQLGTTPQMAQKAIAIRHDFTTAKGMERIGLIVLPDHFPASPMQREMMEHLIRSRIGVELQFIWHTTKHPMTLEVLRAPIPPTMVPLNDVLPVIRSLPKDKVLLGLTGKHEPKHWDMSSEDPHALVSANTRRGKTRLLLLIAAQILAQGAEKVTVIDPKAVGVDECLAGIPGVSVHNNPRDIEDMWKGIRDFRRHMDERVDAYLKDRTLEFSRSLLIIDELSQFSAMSKVYWAEIKDSKDKATPPIFNDIAAILWQGAQFSCSVLVFGQRVEASTLAGLIDSFGTRLLAGFTRKTYERLVGIPPVPVSSRHRGRFVFFDGETPVSIQTVLGSDQELRNLALSGKPIAKTPIIEGTVIPTQEKRAS